LIPALEGRDLIARAKTGTGKTLAFGIPMIKRLMEEDDGRSTRYLFIFLCIFMLYCTRISRYLTSTQHIDYFFSILAGEVVFLGFWFWHLPGS